MRAALTRLVPKWMLPLLLAPLGAFALSACDAQVDENPLAGPPSAVGDASEGLADDCAGIAGTFQAREMRLTSIANPDVVAAFDSDLTDFRITFTSTIFSSRFDRPGIAPFTQTGRYDVLGDEIVFDDVPLIPGLSAGTNRFECRVLDGERVLLVGDGVSYDFAADGTLVPALLEAELEAL